MNKATIRRIGVATAVSVLGVIGLSGTASAQEEDVPILVENLPTAAETLADGLAAAGDTAAETQSAEATSQAVGDALVASGGALVAGTEQFGALGLGFSLINQAVQNALSPYLGAIDDPESAQDLFAPEDAEAIANGLQPFAEASQESIQNGLVHLLQGNIIEPPLGLGPAFWSEAVVGTLAHGFAEFGDTPIGPVFQTAGITSLVVGGAAEGQVTELEAALAPVFEGASPVTGEVIALLEGA